MWAGGRRLACTMPPFLGEFSIGRESVHIQLLLLLSFAQQYRRRKHTLVTLDGMATYAFRLSYLYDIGFPF